MVKGDIIRVEPLDKTIGKSHFVGTVTYIYDPEAYEDGLRFVERCLINRLPEILARGR